ncbi:uncharacterized protein LOC128549995 [Mercenaria mercenaria]|uniref:uncharacterized protein LOC128549995 n=1 Tax=Mercenaria mercenaria TaxID=6596 RepID=UPI00234EB6C0|nr:uncharacterized protein LOC128549995 [Mercenaria mercenaria]
MQQRKLDEKRNKNVEQKEKKLESSVANDPRAVNYEFHDDSDSNTELHKVKTKVKNEVGSEKVKPCSISVGKVEDCCKIIHLEKAPLAQNPLKIECLVKLRRDPSIENFYKTKTDSDSKDSDESECSDSESTTDYKSPEVENEHTKHSDSAESKTVTRQSSSEESLMKAANMIYNADIQIRKSGRLKSAKCASRYRGDYGIRVDTYKQLVNKNENTSGKSDIFESDGKEMGTKRADIVDTETEETAVITSVDNQSERLLDSVKAPHLEKEHSEYKEEKAVLCDDKVDIPTETFKTESSSEEFTVLKEPFADHSGTEGISGTKHCSKTERVSERCIEVNNCEDSKTKSQTEGRDLLNCDTVYHKKVEVQLYDKEVSEVETETSEVAENNLPQSESGECIQLCNDSVDSCGCKSGNDIVRVNNEYDSRVRETECPEVLNEVPCTYVIEGNQSCACDIRLENDPLQTARNASCELSDHEVKSETYNLVPVSSETETDTKTIKEIHSQLTKENVNEMLVLLQSTAKNNGNEHTAYVHSVGKSVNKMQKRIKTKRPDHNIRPENIENEITPESSPVKDPAKVLETLRQKLFESAGADVEEADKVPKQFESKLISSKQRQSEDSKSSVILDLQEKDRQIRDSDSTSGRSGKSTPRCSTPRQESGMEILEEVALSLDVLHQAKRRFENSSKVAPAKRQRFEEKTFLLRSMIKKIDDADGNPTSQQAVELEDEKPVNVGRIAERTRSSRSSAESSASKSDVHKINRKRNVKTIDLKVKKRDNTQEKPIQKSKPVKCSACSHIFKTKDLLRKHFPCRIRQTRTWSQNKLRPNRAVKRIENGSKKFVCRLPKAGRPEPSKPRPQLLTYRKTKFRRVKGKRRRKLYQLIQELRQRRMPVKWRHLSIVYDDLSFKEQCLYKLGLICVGSASEGLERYTAEEITVFEQHRAKEKWLMEDAQTFEHSIPDTLESLTDLNLSTELSTDNQESDFFSPKHVITFPQENIRNRICDIDDTTKEDKGEGAINEISTVKIYENDLNISENIDSVQKTVAPCFAFYPGLEEKETDTVYEKTVDLQELPEKLSANISIQEYLDFFRSSKVNTDSDDNIRCTDDAMISVETGPRSQNIAQLETFAAVEEGTECFEETLEISQDSGIMISLKGNLIDNPLRSANVTEINVKTTDLKHVNESNIYEPKITDLEHAHKSKMNESSDNPLSDKHLDVSQQELMSESHQQEENKTGSESVVFSVQELVSDKGRLSCTHSDTESKTDLKLSKCFEIVSRDVQEGQSLELCTVPVIASVLPPCAEKDIQKPVPESESRSATTYTEKDIRKPESENKSALKYPVKDNPKHMLGLGKRQTCLGKHEDGTIERTSSGVEIREQLNKFSPRKKFAVAPDIELYHQTAIIDDTLLADTPLAVQHDKKSDKDSQIIPPSNKINEETSKEEEIIETDYISTTKSDSNLDSELVFQASGILKDILGDVEQSVKDGKEAHLPDVKKTATSIIDDIASVEKNADISKVTNVNLNISPVKGILKNAGPQREYAGLSPLKSNTGLSDGKVHVCEKAPGKKKIDFKTYAKRKGMIKEKYEKEKECIQSEVQIEVEDTKTKEIRNEKDENGKECLRSESHHEIEDGLLGRLLDAVNVIDSIIEEHRYQSGPEEDDDSFNAITPEMAFEAAISNKRVENSTVDAVSKPYDIESVFPYSEIDKMINAEKLHFTEIQDLSVNNENDNCKLTDTERNPVQPSIDKSVLQGTEITCNKSPNVSLVMPSDYNNTVEMNTHLSLCSGNDEDLGEAEDSSEMVKGTQVLTEKVSPVNLEKHTCMQQMAAEKFEILESKSVEIRIGNTDEKVSHDSIGDRFEEIDEEESETHLSENTLDPEVTGSINAGQPSLEKINTHLKPPVNEHVFLENVEFEMRSKNDYINEIPNIKDTYSEDHTQEDISREEKDENDDELMKSPEHIPKKRMRRPDDPTSIKESKRDFTIKYEVNGIVIKENLLTGDKNVVENSSPFRSSAESDSNFDQSSVSEFDVSSVVENDISFSSNIAFEETDTDENSSNIAGKIDSHLMLDSNVEDDTEKKRDTEDSYIRSSEEVVTVVKQGKEIHDNDTNHVLEEPMSNSSLEISQELDLENQSEIVTKDAELNIDIQETEKDTNFIEENCIDTGAEGRSLNICDNYDEEMSPENVPCLEMEPLLRADVQLLRKVSDDHSVGSPPVLEKVEVSDSSMDEQDKENTSQETTLTADGGPPLLEPQLLEESKEEHAKQTKHEAAHPGRQERHFLDILGTVNDEGHESAIFPDFQNQTKSHDDKGSKRSEKSLLEGLYSEESTLSDSIGRHFSDVVSETVEAPKTPKSKLQFLFDKSETGDVTLAQIKDVLSPFSKKGKKKSIPKESLLKIKSGIADLLLHVKKPERKDPTWLKRDSLSSYSRRKNIKKSSYKDEKMNDLESSSDESITAPDEIVYISSDSSEDFDTGNRNPSKGSVADTIMQMLDSLEDKGSVADNMSNLLGILAENLGFLGEGKAGEQTEDLSSDSDYSYNEEISLTKSSSTENSQKELIADYLEEGEQPPSLDDIPVASTFELNWIKDDTETIKDDKERLIETKEEMFEPARQFSGKIAVTSLNSLAEKSGQTHLEGVVEFHTESVDTGEMFSKNTKIPVIGSVFENSKHGREPVLNNTKSMSLNLENSEENSAVATEHSKDDKCKATTIFKSITELNSIETDEESNTDESFDAVSMSVRLSELKDTNTWEFNSDYNSDQEQSDDFDSDFANDFEPQTEHAVSEEDATAPSAIKNDNSKDAAERESPEVTNPRYVDDIENKDGKTFKCKNFKPGELFPLKLFPKESSNPVFSELDEKANYIEDAGKEFTSKEYATKLNSSQVEHRNETEVSRPSPIVDNTDREHVSEINLLSGFDKRSTKSVPDKSLLPSSDSCIANNSTEKKYKSFVKKIEEAAAIFSPHADAKEDIFNDGHQSEGHEVNDSHSLKDVNYHDSDFNDENILGVSEKLNSDSRHTDSVATLCEVKDSGDIYESTEVAGNHRKQLLRFSDEETEFTGQTSSLKTTEKIGDLELISEVNDLPAQRHKPKTVKETESRLESLHNDKNMKDSNRIISTSVTDSFNDSQILTDDEDTNETVTYDEQEEAKTDILGLIGNVSDTNLGIDKADDSMLVSDGLTSSSLLENTNSQEISLWKEADKIDDENIPFDKDKGKTSFKIQENKSEGSRQETQFKGSDTCSSPQIENTQKTVFEEDEQLTKKRSISFNIDDADFSDNFCESIAEKVKRKQRERSHSVCYSFNPWLYYSAAYVREVTKPAKKEISVFRSSILEKRAREKSFSPEKDVGCSSRKKRNSSVPKEAKFGTNNENTYTDYRRCSPEPKPVIQLKPCSVAIPKLTDDIIRKYTNRKRKPEEDNSENRPPIKVTIKLSQIVYPPNSPYGSTSTSSDNYRSGYESCSEESETDTKEPDKENEFEIEKQEEIMPKHCYAQDLNYTSLSDERSLKTEVSSREPLKIKMRTLLTKMSSCEEGQDAPNSIPEFDPVGQFSGSFNESSNETNVEVSTGELIESEVLHDIKRECEKVKSREKDIIFYLSESDDDSEPDTSRKDRQQLLKAVVEKHDNLRTEALSISSVQAECGESDVDLSDSDTDAEIQEEIDKILNSKSSRDFSAALNQDEDIDTSQTKMKKGRNSLMKMIVSDLRLSESESDSEIEYNKKTEDTLPEENDCKNVNLKANECTDENSNDNSKIKWQKIRDVTHLCVTENRVDSKIFEKGSIQVTENNVQESIYTASPRDDSGTLIQEKVYSTDQEFLRPGLNDDFIDKEHIVLPNVAENVIEPLDLSMSSKQNVKSSSLFKKDNNKLRREEMRGSSNDIVEKKFPDENLLMVSSEFQEIETNQYSDRRSFNDNAVTSSSTLKQEMTGNDLECSQLTENSGIENYELSTVVPNKPMENDNDSKQLHNLDNEILLPGHGKEVEMADEQKSLKYEVNAGNQASSDNVSYFEAERQEKGMKDLNLTYDGSAKTEAENYANSPEDVSENTVMSEEETKEMENVSAVKNLEEDVFHDVQPIQDSTEDGMVYYAVELSDDLETNEAVVNLETVELIEGPIIIENNVTHEQNILDTNIIQSHVNDQMGLSNETLNEQIVETLNEAKPSSELRIDSALQSMTQMENPVFYPTVNDVKSKYLYGINEDSQSSNEVVEELVTEIVNDNTVLEQVTIETRQIFSEVSSIENPINGEKFTNTNPVHAQYISESSVEGDVIPVNLVSSHVICESSGNTEKFPDVQEATSEKDKVSKITDQTEMKMDTSESIDSEMRGANDSLNIECTSYPECDKWTDIDKKRMPLNISESNVDTREMCSQHDSFIPFKADNLSHGYDLIGNATVVKESSNVDRNRMCAESSDINESRLSVDSGVNSFVQGYDNCAMIIEHSDVNDYIITQNENFEDDEDDDAMDFV